jgi:four helix bundle protein
MRSRPEELRDRTKAFALRVIRLFRSLPYKTDTQVLGKQLLRCGTSVAANYRAVCRARSKAEFIARLGIAAEEADEAVLWLELLIESGILKSEMTVGLLKEARELAAILTASRQTARKAA